MSAKLEKLAAHLTTLLGNKARRVAVDAGELKVLTSPEHYVAVAQTLRDDPLCRFEQMVDLCGVDYSEYTGYEGARFCTVLHLLSVSLNQRLRLKVFAADDDFPVLPSVTGVWSSANWFEREAFDLFGIVYDGHNDLRRILTDYGFIGHPFRKDFPVTGHVEMKYDEATQRVVYQPVTIDPREITPRIVREENYGVK